MRNDIEKRILSVIVPVYNAEQYLDQCISSILDQSFSDFYLFLVNDEVQIILEIFVKNLHC